MKQSGRSQTNAEWCWDCCNSCCDAPFTPPSSIAAALYCTLCFTAEPRQAASMLLPSCCNQKPQSYLVAQAWLLYKAYISSGICTTSSSCRGVQKKISLQEACLAKSVSACKILNPAWAAHWNMGHALNPQAGCCWLCRQAAWLWTV